MSSSEVHEQEANQPSTDSQNPDQTSRTDHSIEALRQFFEQNPGLSNFLKKCLTYIPFLILILLKEISKHTTGKCSKFCVLSSVLFVTPLNFI